jgi:23S rRNA pseudouridine1911/1915/1917 synthase
MSEELEVLYEDNHLIAVNKRAGEPVQIDITKDLPLEERVKSYIKEKYNKPGNIFLGIIHRIDRPVSGVVLFAKTSKALTRMNDLIKDRKIKKTYLAIVNQAPNPIKGSLAHYLVRNNKQNKTYITEKGKKEAKEALLNYEIIANSERYFLIKIDLITGRHHQIRAQLSGIDCPIVGDLKYGFKRSNDDASICLHSTKMEFTHPVNSEKVQILASFPKQKYWKLFENVKHL